MFATASGLDKLSAALEEAMGDENDARVANAVSDRGNVAKVRSRVGDDARDNAPANATNSPVGLERKNSYIIRHGDYRQSTFDFTNLGKRDSTSRYTVGATIGQGSFGKVKKATDTLSGQLVAVKLVDGSKFRKSEYVQFKNEVDVMREIIHPNAVRLYAVYEYEPQKYAMVMEYAAGGELFERIQEKGNFNEEEASSIMRQLLQCLNFMHSDDHKIAHRDLKPENILFSSRGKDAEVKLTDFGFAKRVSSKDPHNMLNPDGPMGNVFTTRLGSPNYVAPEILASRKSAYGVEVDVWSLGVILYIMLCGYFPFYSDSEKELYKQIKGAKYDFPEEEWKHVSDAAKDLVRSMLTADPRLRATAADCLRHPWIQSPDVPCKLPFPQQSIERLRVFVEAHRRPENDTKGPLQDINDKLTELKKRISKDRNNKMRSEKGRALQQDRNDPGAPTVVGVNSTDINNAVFAAQHAVYKDMQTDQAIVLSASDSISEIKCKRKSKFSCGVCAIQ